MKPIIKLYEYTTSIKLLALIDDYEACSWERNKYAKGQFSIEINYNIPNATKFRKGLIVQFGNDEKNVGIIRRIQKSIAEDGKGSEKLSITGYDLRDLFSQRIIENLNNNDTYTVSGSGETCIRSLVASQCGVNATEKRRLPIVNGSSTGLGLDCSVSEAYSNLYDVLETIATQSLIGWGVKLVGNEFVLYFYEGIDRHNTVKFSVEFDSLSNGSFDDTDENKVNAVFIGGKGTGDNRDIYEVEDATSGETLSGLNRFEGFSNQSSLTEESEYLKAGTSILTESLQTLSFSGAGLEKCPYVYKDNYDVGDSITVSFSGTTAIVEIVSLSEHWSASGYDMDFDFGKPVADLQRQLKILLTQIRTAEATANSTTKSNVKYYTIPTDTEMPKADVILDVIGFTGDIGNTDKEFELYFDSESKTGAKTYHVYFKNLTGSGKLKLKVGASNLSFSGGTYVAIIYVDESGEVRNMGSLSDAVVSATTAWSSEKTKEEIDNKINDNTEENNKTWSSEKINNIMKSLPTDAILHYSFDDVPEMPDGNANIRYKNGQTYSLMNIAGANISPTITNVNGNLNVKGNADGSGIFIFGLTGSILVIKIKIKLKTSGAILLGFENFNNTFVTESGVYAFPFDSNNIHAFIAYSYGDTREFEIEEFYTGDGSYNTPIIDNSYGGYNSSYIRGIIATKGVCGKGITLPNSNSDNDRVVISDVFNKLYSDFTFGIWVNPENKIENVNDNIIASAEQFILRNGASWSNTLMLYVYTNVNGTVQENCFNMVGLLDADKWTHIVITKNGTTVKLYIDGELGYTGTCQGSILNHNSNSVNLPTTQRTKLLDDLQIFNRALSEAEVKALYLNRGNTPKFYTRADYLLDNQN